MAQHILSQYLKIVLFSVAFQYDLVCSKSILAETSQTIFKGGSMLAEIFGSYTMDRFGRKKMHIIGFVLVSGVGTAVAYLDNLVAFSILRAVLGFFVTVSNQLLLISMLLIFHPAIIRCVCNVVFLFSVQCNPKSS